MEVVQNTRMSHIKLVDIHIMPPSGVVGVLRGGGNAEDSNGGSELGGVKPDTEGELKDDVGSVLVYFVNPEALAEGDDVERPRSEEVGEGGEVFTGNDRQKSKVRCREY